MIKRSVDRRDFLKGAAVTSAAALVPGSVAAAASPQAAPPAQTPATAPVPAARNRPGRRCRSAHDRSARRRLHGRRPQVARTSSTSPRTPARASAASTNRSSTTAATRSRSSSPAATKSRLSRWRRPTSRPRASRWPCCATARSACSTPSMAIYNAYCDRVPVYMLAGNSLDATHAAARRRVGAQRPGRRGDGPRLHQVGRHPVSLPHFAESAVRAYKIAMTPPMSPVLVVIDGGLQEDPIPAGDRRPPAGAEADDDDPAAGRFGRRGRSRAPARQRAEPGDRRRPRRAHARRHRAS